MSKSYKDNPYITPDLKRCTACYGHFHPTNFHINRMVLRDGLNPTCKRCHSEKVTMHNRKVLKLKLIHPPKDIYSTVKFQNLYVLRLALQNTVTCKGFAYEPMTPLQYTFEISTSNSISTLTLFNKDGSLYYGVKFQMTPETQVKFETIILDYFKSQKLRLELTEEAMFYSMIHLYMMKLSKA